MSFAIEKLIFLAVSRRHSVNDKTAPPRLNLFHEIDLRISFFALAWVFVGLFGTENILADVPEPTFGTPVIGWNGTYIVGRWTQVLLPVKSYKESTAQLELTAVDSDGHRVSYFPAPMRITEEQQSIIGLMKVGRLDGPVEIVVNRQSPPSFQKFHGVPKRANWLKAPLMPSVRLILTIGDPQGFDFDADSEKLGVDIKDIEVVSVKPEFLPANSLAYDGVAALVICGAPKLTEVQANALKEWVASGGRLILSLPFDIKKVHESVETMNSWLPVKIGDQPVIVREFGGMETFSGKNIRMPHAGTLSIPSLKIESGEVLAASRSDAFLVRAPYGMGSVSVLAMDLSAKPASEWKALPPFCTRLVGLDRTTGGAEKEAAKNAQLSSTGINDLATQVHAIQDHFESVSRPTPWFIIGLLFSLMMIVGPIDYLIVHRILKKPQLTWLTYPCLISAGSILATWIATSSNGIDRRVNQLDIMNVDVATSTARGRHFINLYSPTTTQNKISVEPIALTKQSSDATIRLSWNGVPESSFGGILRKSGFEQGASYQQLEDATLAQLPVVQWSSKSLIAESVQRTDGLIESQLQASPTGRLTGTITHHFADSIEDWLIVYKNVAYRHLKKKDDPESIPFPANRVWRVDQPAVFSRELRPFLTGINTMATPRFGAPANPNPTQQQTTYDPLSLDSSTLVRILTFHGDAGGDRYTGLTNQVLETEDFSHLLKLGRAILFGRIQQPLVKIQSDEKLLDPEQKNSFVRIILPVAPATEVIKDLKRVVPN